VGAANSPQLAAIGMRPSPERKKPQTGEVRRRRAEPPPNVRGPGWEGRGKRRLMAGNGRSIGLGVEHDDNVAENSALPATLLGDQARHESQLLRQRHQESLQIGQSRLDLYEEQGALARMPSEDVDRAAFAVEVEREFRVRLPAKPSQFGDDRLDYPGVVAIDQPIALPPRRRSSRTASIWSAAHTLRNRSTETRSICPRSSNDTIFWSTPAVRPTST